MRIGLLSDSHKDTSSTRRLIDHLKASGADYLIHAGDFELPENLDYLHAAGLPYVSVFGNNDLALASKESACAIYPEPHYFSIQGVRFKLMHMPYYLSADGADVIVFGHTHQATFKYNEGILVVNPGEVCARETGRHEAMLLDVTETAYTITRCFFEAGGPIQTRKTELIR